MESSFIGSVSHAGKGREKILKGTDAEENLIFEDDNLLMLKSY